MLDQSHNVTDPVESLVNSAIEVQRSYIKSLMVNRETLYGYQDANDALMAANTLKAAFNTDVSPILAMARFRQGGAIDPIAAFRVSDYRQQVAKARPPVGGGGSGIV